MSSLFHIINGNPSPELFSALHIIYFLFTKQKFSMPKLRSLSKMFSPLVYNRSLSYSLTIVIMNTSGTKREWLGLEGYIQPVNSNTGA